MASVNGSNKPRAGSMTPQLFCVWSFALPLFCATLAVVCAALAFLPFFFVLGAPFVAAAARAGVDTEAFKAENRSLTYCD